MKQLIKQLFFYFLSLISISLPQTLSSYSRAKVLQAKIHFSDSNNSRTKTLFRNPSYHSFESSHQTDLVYSHAPAIYFQKRFQDIKPAKILTYFDYYKYPGFIEFIKTLPRYKEHIEVAHNILSDRWWIIDFPAKFFSGTKSSVKEIIQQLYDEVQKEKIHQLSSLDSLDTDCQTSDVEDSQLVSQPMDSLEQSPNDNLQHTDCQTSDVKHSQLVSQRKDALEQSLDDNLQHSLYKSNWSDVDPTFIQEFNLDSCTCDLNGTKIQHALQKEFHDIAKKTAQVRKSYRDNAYIDQLVEKNVTCIKNGITRNQVGRVKQAAHFADIAWAILDHLQALGEGIAQGTGNVAHVFSHPIDTIKGTGQAIAQLIYYAGQATLEVVDLCILGVTNQNAADKKLQAWKQNFTTLMDTIHKQLQETENRDITKFVSRLTTEVLLTRKVSHGLGSFFSFARTKATKLIQKAQKPTKSVIQVTTPEGITAQVNKVVKYMEGASKTGSTVKQTGATRLRKTGGPIKEKALQIRQSRQPAKTGNPAKQNPGTRLQKKSTAIKEKALQRRSPLPIKTYEGSLTNNNLKSNIIKGFNNIEDMKIHIFSPRHLDGKILHLGKNKDDIVNKFVNIIKIADGKGLLKAGPNQIHTIINNHKVVIRTFIKEGTVLKINGFKGTTARNLGNTFELLITEYHYG